VTYAPTTVGTYQWAQFYINHDGYSTPDNSAIWGFMPKHITLSGAAIAATGGGGGDTGGGGTDGGGGTGGGGTGGGGDTGGGGAGGGGTTPQPQPPTVVKPPVKPAPAKVVFVGKQPRLAALGASGAVKLKLPVKERGVKVVFQLRVNASQAKVLGLKLPKGRKVLVIGTGTITTKAAGSPTVTVRLTRAAKQAFKSLGGRTSKVARAKASLAITLSKAGKSSSLAKQLTFSR
jgi:hypothetical protein